MDELEHYGIKGMHWGIRRTPEQLGHKNLKKARTSNFEKWGKSPETNTLWITGRSGSGKSTVAKSIARPGDKIIHLDCYSDEVSQGAGLQNKDFNNYLDKVAPRWRDISTAHNNNAKLKFGSKAYWNEVDKFAKAIDDFSKKQYKSGNRVIVEGIQITDGWLHLGYDHYKNQPMAILGTSKARSLAQEFTRDQRKDPVYAIKEYFSKSGTTWSQAWDKQLSEITHTVNAKKGSKAVDEYLKKYSQRSI